MLTKPHLLYTVDPQKGDEFPFRRLTHVYSSLKESTTPADTSATSLPVEHRVVWKGPSTVETEEWAWHTTTPAPASSSKEFPYHRLTHAYSTISTEQPNLAEETDSGQTPGTLIVTVLLSVVVVANLATAPLVCRNAYLVPKVRALCEPACFITHISCFI